MQLGQSVPVRIKDHHATGLRHIHADLDHSGRHQNRRGTGCEIGHDPHFGLIIIPAGQCGKANAGELRQSRQTFFDFGHGMQWRTLCTLFVVLAQLIQFIERAPRILIR